MNATLAVDAQMTAGSTVSKDGIPIGYRRRSAGRRLCRYTAATSQPAATPS